MMKTIEEVYDIFYIFDVDKTPTSLQEYFDCIPNFVHREYIKLWLLGTLVDWDVEWAIELETLDLSYHNFTSSSLPEPFFELPNLKELNLSHNKFTDLPESIGKLSTLTKLHVSYNQLTTFPDSFGNLKNLSYLDADWNQWMLLFA